MDLATFVPGYSGASAVDFHHLPSLVTLAQGGGAFTGETVSMSDLFYSPGGAKVKTNFSPNFFAISPFFLPRRPSIR